MAGTITYQFQAQLSNGLLGDQYASGSLSEEQTTAALVRNVVDVLHTAHQLLDLGDVSTPGFGVFQNLDDTNPVRVGLDVGGSFYTLLKVPAGQQMPCWLGTSGIYVKADTATVSLFYLVYAE